MSRRDVAQASGWIALAVASFLLMQRGFLRGVDGSLDLTMIYAGARAVFLGVDAYSFGPLYDLFLEAGGTGKDRDPDQFVSLYPPTTYLLLSPLGMLAWPTARLAWLTVNALAAAATVFTLTRLKLPERQGPLPARLLLIAAWLAWAPLHTGVSLGQLSLLCTVLMLPVAAAPGCTPGRGTAAAAGIALGLAGAIKPQLAVYLGPAVLLTCWRSAGAWAVATAALVGTAAVLRLQLTSPGWVEVWTSNVAQFTGGSIGRPNPTNPQFHEMMHLETPIGVLLPTVGEATRRWVASAVPIGVFLGVGARLLLQHRLHPLPERVAAAWLALAALLTLVTGYHRSYDATLLLVALIWLGPALIREPRRKSLWVAAAAAALFLAPTPSLLVAASRRGWLPGGLLEAAWWQMTGLQAHTWAALIWAAVLVRELLRRDQRGRNAPEAVLLGSSKNSR